MAVCPLVGDPVYDSYRIRTTSPTICSLNLVTVSFAAVLANFSACICLAWRSLEASAAFFFGLPLSAVRSCHISSARSVVPSSELWEPQTAIPHSLQSPIANVPQLHTASLREPPPS